MGYYFKNQQGLLTDGRTNIHSRLTCMLKNMFVLIQGTTLLSMSRELCDTLENSTNNVDTYLTVSRGGRASCRGWGGRTVPGSGSWRRRGAGGGGCAGRRGARRRERTPARAVPCRSRECRVYSSRRRVSRDDDVTYVSTSVRQRTKCGGLLHIQQTYPLPLTTSLLHTRSEYTGAFSEYYLIVRQRTISSAILNTLVVL